MASPQCENGYTRLANELLDALLNTRLAGQEYQVVLAILRKTYGYGKKADQISYGQLSRMTGINRPRIVALIQSLTKKNVIGVTNNGNRKPITLWIQKDYDRWQGVPKKDTSPKNGNRSVPNNGNKGVPNNGTHKRKKERKEIPTYFFDFSKRFLEYQQGQHGKLVKITEKKVNDGAEVVEKLSRIDGYDLNDEIRPALWWAVQDDFWSKNVLSLAGLRKKGQNGEMKFVNLYASYKRSLPKRKVIEEVF